MVNSATKSRKNSGGRLQRGIEKGSSVKMRKKIIIMCLGTKQKKWRKLTIGLEKSLDRWIDHCKTAIKIWLICEKGKASVSLFWFETGNISEKKPYEIHVEHLI